MPGRFLGTVAAGLALALVGAGSSAAASLTFDGRVLRYRADSSAFAVVSPEPLATPQHLRVSLVPPVVDFGFGCDELGLSQLALVDTL